MIRKLLFFFRSLFFYKRRNFKEVFAKKKFNFKSSAILYVIFFLLFINNVTVAQTTDLFQFNFEGTTAVTVDNVLGTPTFTASSGVDVLGYSNATPCQGTNMYNSRSWSAGDYYRFVVNTTGYNNLKFSFCNRASTPNIGEFLVRVSTNSGGNWTVVDDFTPTTSNSTIETGIFPTTANNATTVWIEIYKSVSGGDNGRQFLIDNVTLTSYAIPTITTFNSSPVCSGSTPSVTIAGTNLTGATAVNFNGVPATSFTVNSGGTQITATLPATASTGYITVTTPGGTAASAAAFVVNPSPTITASASPTSVISGGSSVLTATDVTEKTIVLQEGFNGSTNTWTKNNTSSGGTTANAAWTLQPAGYYYYYGNPYPGYQFTSNDNSQFYLSNSAAQGSAGTTNTQLISPAMNTVGYTSLSLEFYQFYLDFDNDDFAYVDVSTNGSSWTNLITYSSNQGSQSNFRQTTLNLNSYINSPTLYVRFRYTGRFDWFWAIDNVTVSGDKTIACNYSWVASPSGTAGLPTNAGSALTTNKSITVNPTQTTDYTVTATNIATGCSASASPVTVTILAPTITSFTPTSVCVGPSTSVVITGTNFMAATAVNFNGVAASSFTVNSNTQITATVPSTATSGTISVTTAGGTATSASTLTINRVPASLSYTTSTATYCTGTAITSNTATLGTAGVPAATFSISPALPAGLSISSTTGTISGTPTASATSANYTVTATNSCGSTTAVLNITVNRSPASLSYASSTVTYCTGTAITSNTTTLGTTGVPAATFSISPALPVGLSISSTTGTISGTPTASSASANYTVTATNSCGLTTAVVNITVNSAPVSLSYASSTVTYCTGTAITSNTATLGTTGVPAATFSISPALPAGLAISSTTGTISGTPTASAASANYTVTATNSCGSTTAVVNITVNIAPASLSYATSTATYCTGTAITSNTATLGTTGVPAATFSISPALPAGLSISSTTGAISGTPTASAASANYTVTATNSCGSTTAVVNITVNRAPASLSYASSTVTYCTGTAITSNTATLGTTGVPVATFSISPALPAGLSISSTTGTISGTPTASAASANYTVTATNSCGSTTAVVNITVNRAPASLSYASSTVTYCTGTAITSNTATLGTTGVPAATFSISPVLPAGLSISSTTGAISGTPTASAASANYTVTATNSCGITTAVVNITINRVPASLSYVSSTVSYCIGTTISSNTATLGTTGVPVATFSVSPTLPAGLSISSTTGTISGTPTTNAASTNYTITATNSCGSTTAVVNITVNPLPIITTQPQPLNRCEGQNGTFTVATSAASPTYQWEYSASASGPTWTVTNGEAGVSGHNTSTLSLTAIPVSYSGFYVRCVVTSNGCSTISGTAQLTVTPNLSAVSITPTGSQALCETTSGTSLTVVETGGGTITSRQWGKRSTSGGAITSIASATGNTYTPTGASLGVGTWFIVCTSTPTCGSAIVSNEVSVSVSANITASVAIGVSPTGAVCAGASLTFTATPTNGGTTPVYQWKVNGGNVGTNSTTFTTTTLADGDIVTCQMTSNATPCLVGSPATSNQLTASIKPNHAAPVVGTITKPTCTTPTGSVVLSGLPATGSLLQNDGTSTTTVAITGTSMTISGLNAGTYTFAIDNGCSITYSSNVVIEFNTWNGTSWSYGVPPTINDVVTFTGNYTISADMDACSCTVNNNAAVIVAGGKTLHVANGVHVATGSSLTFQNNASLLQDNTSNTLNTGVISYIRDTYPIRQADYTYWSSPVKGQTLGGVSPDTEDDKYYSFTSPGWVSENITSVMTAGKGYIIRGPEYFLNTSRAVYTATFEGVPNNGDITGETAVANTFYLVGNPYPSALDADEFIGRNNFLEGTLYFWTHNTPVVLGGYYRYSTDDYAVYNLSGGTATRPALSAGNPSDTNASTPLGYIAAGQSFFAGAVLPGVFKFDNLMRAGENHNSQFFKPGSASKTTTLEKNRLWINMTNTEGAFKQILVGYIEGATNAYERRYDGTTLDGNKYLDFYSVSDGKRLVIQGRGLPFTDTDTVPLGYRSTIAGDFTISIESADGSMQTQAIYLEDKLTGTIHDLRASNYTFTTAIGTFSDRLVLRYTNKTLGTGDFENIENGIVVSSRDKAVQVFSSKENIQEVTIFDITGKLLYNKKKVGSTELKITDLQIGNQVLLVKVSLENGHQTSRKVIFQ